MSCSNTCSEMHTYDTNCEQNMSPNMPDGLDIEFDDHDTNLDLQYDAICKRLDAIEKDIAEFKELAGKIWGFVEQMKTNPMFAAMLGGLPR